MKIARIIIYAMKESLTSVVAKLSYEKETTFCEKTKLRVSLRVSRFARNRLHRTAVSLNMHAAQIPDIVSPGETPSRRRAKWH